ncbi:MAG: MBL fold metallo-hydrolase [Pseudomonadota bacterium]
MSRLSRSAEPRLLVAALSLLAVATAQAQQDFSEVQIDAQAVAGSVYMLTGAGGNIGVSAGEDGVIIVDDQYAPLASKIRNALAELAGDAAPIRFVINTHYHGDHTGGNETFQGDYGAAVIAHENVRKRLAEGGKAGNKARIAFDLEPAAQDALPVITFHDGMTLHLNGEDIRAMHLAHGHTDGDAIIYFAKANVVHMGDNFVTYGFPFVDLSAGGTVDGMIHTVEHVLSALPEDVKVIPGHGDLSTTADMRRFVAMLRDTQARVKAAHEEGVSLAQMKEQNLLAAWADAWGGGFVKVNDFIDTLYNDLTQQQTSARDPDAHGHH